MRSSLLLVALATCISNAAAHLVINYPGWRGDNLKNTGNTADGGIPDDGLGVHYNNDTNELEYPYGMQWIYPCKSSPSSPSLEELLSWRWSSSPLLQC
jgi:hypothetical protein